LSFFTKLGTQFSKKQIKGLKRIKGL